MLKDFVSLIYPNVCVSCGKNLYKNEYCICTCCIYHLPKTNYHFSSENPIAKLFWGRVNIHSAAAYYKFEKGSKTQHLIHQLKYRGKKEIGLTIGKLYGNELKKSSLFNTINLIIPVPLHSRKQRKRGYNQSDFFAKGLSESIGVGYSTNALSRVRQSDSQTKKARFKRWENVASIFKVKDADQLEGKHILLVDDVVTTGATLEACVQALLEIPHVKVSIAAIASARA